MIGDFRKYLAEGIGTYCLVFAGTGAIVVNDVHGSVTHIGISLAFGLVVMAMVYAFEKVSGAHINPAVTIAFWVSGKFSTKDVAPYVLAQITGAILASLSIRMLFPDNENLGCTLPAGSWQQSFILEAILTAILMFVIFRVAANSWSVGALSGVAIGGTVGLECLLAGPVCGASMNPARSLAPAVISGMYEHLWVYLVATVLGALLAVAIEFAFDRLGAESKPGDVP